jgi:hypothetical protein
MVQIEGENFTECRKVRDRCFMMKKMPKNFRKNGVFDSKSEIVQKIDHIIGF